MTVTNLNLTIYTHTYVHLIYLSIQLMRAGDLFIPLSSHFKFFQFKLDFILNNVMTNVIYGMYRKIKM